MSHLPPTESTLRSDKELFFEAFDLPNGDERAALLDRVCADDPEKRQRLEALLATHFRDQAFMAYPAVEISPPARADIRGEDLGSVIGRYKPLEKLGEGGFGTVYLAEQRNR